MSPEPKPPARRISRLLLQLGVLGVFVTALGLSTVSFALFGCYCFEGRSARLVDPPPEKAEPPKFPDPAAK